MKPFEYLAPTSLEQALDMLSDHEGEAAVMAGGTDLIPALKEKSISPKYVIHLDKLDELRFIKEELDYIKIGPLVTMNDLLESDLIVSKLSALAQAAEQSAAPQVRNLGTIGGNLGTASSAGDLCLALIALGAKVTVAGKAETKEYAVEDFFSGTKKSVLSANQLITEITVPKLPANTGSSFKKLGKRKGMTIAFASSAAAVTVDPSLKTIKSVKVAMGALAQKPVVAKSYSDALAGVSAADTEEIKKLSKLVENEIEPRTGRSTAEYRKDVACVLAAQCVEESLNNLKR